MFRNAAATTSTAVLKILALSFLMLGFLSGCAVQEELHFRVAPTLENPREIKLGGMVTDQLLALCEQMDGDTAQLFEILRAQTDASPIVVANPLLIDKTMQEIWVEAIQPNKHLSFRNALRIVQLRPGDRALCIRLIGTVNNRRAGYWAWCNRDFVGEPVKHADTLESQLPRIVVATDRAKFVFADTNETFVPWGFDVSPTERLEPAEDTDWAQVNADFAEMKMHGANLVRVHLQVGNFMDSPTKPNVAALNRLRRLIGIAEREGMYLDIHGLANFEADLIPPWFDRLSERRRWDTQAVFWGAIARTCAASNAIFCYDLINEPVLDGGPDSDVSPWLVGEAFGGKYYYVQRLVKDLRGRDPIEVRKAWVDKMVAAIRQHDPVALTTVGVIPWPIVFGGGQPSFYNNTVDENLDFVSVHVYPQQKDQDPVEMDKLIEGLEKYDYGKPLLIEETSSFQSSNEIWGEFLDRSAASADGWISQYFGPVDELEANGDFVSLFQKSIFEFWLTTRDALTAAAQ